MKGRMLFGLALIVLWPDVAIAVCNLSTSALSFGNYRPLDSAHRDSTGQVVVSCRGPAGLPITYVVRMSAGTGGSFAPRTLRRGQSELAYNLYRNAARSRILGDGTVATETVVRTFTLPGGGPVVRTHTVYGRLFARQSVGPGGYADLVQVTLETCTTGQCVVSTATLSVR